jgi:hypothetical protein
MNHRAFGPDPTAAPNVREARRVVGWGLGFWGAAQLAVAFFGNNSTALAASQAVLAEWGAGRVGVTWSSPLMAVPSGRTLAKRAGLGAAMGMAAACLLVALALATRSATAALASPAVASLALGLVVSALSAVRDELFLRGVVLRATRGLLPAWAALAACGAAAAAGQFGVEGMVGLSLLVQALRGVALASLWIRDRGAWMAVGASAAWTWSLQSAMRGGLFDVRFATDSEAGIPALITVTIAAALGLLWASARRHPT